MSSIPAQTPGVIYRFGRFELLPETEELRKRGAVISLAPQPFRVLLLLVVRAGKIVTREEIQQELWGSETFVGFEQGINVAISRIRLALNDDAESPRFLQTHPRRGYSLIVPVECVLPSESTVAATPVATEWPETPPAAAQSPRFARLAATVIALLAILLTARGPHDGTVRSTPKVLRIAFAGGGFPGGGTALDPQGLLGELQSRLAQLQPAYIRVAAPGEIADVRLDAALRRDAAGLIADTRLVETSSGRPLWSETFRGKSLPDDFALEVAIRVTRAVLELHVPPASGQGAPRTSVSPRALALYREGDAMRALPIPQRNCDRAIELFEQSVALEPRFTEAWSAIGDIWTERALSWTGQARRTAISEARIALGRALAIDPMYAEAVNNRGVLLMSVDRDYAGAEREIRKAIASDPENVDAHINLALILAATARHSEALSYMRRAQLLDPASYVPSPVLAFFYLMARRYNEACAEYRASQLVFHGNGMSHWGMMSAAIGAGRWDDAAHSLSAILGEPIEIPRDARNPAAEFRTHLHRLEQSLAAKERNDIDPYLLACFYAQAGDTDRAFAELDRAAVAQSAYTLFAAVDPRLDSLRDDPRFIDRLDQFGLVR